MSQNIAAIEKLASIADAALTTDSGSMKLDVLLVATVGRHPIEVDRAKRLVSPTCVSRRAKLARSGRLAAGVAQHPPLERVRD